MENLQKLDCVQHCFLAYFQYILDKYGVNLSKMQPKYPPIKKMIDNYFLPDIDYSFMRKFYSDKIIIENRNLEELDENGIENFFNEDFKKPIEKSAINLAEIINKFPFSDIIFSAIHEDHSFLCSDNSDDETKFRGRLEYGKTMHLFKKDKGTFIFEFYCLIMERYRKIDSIKNYGDTWMPVSIMTKEQREKFDK